MPKKMTEKERRPELSAKDIFLKVAKEEGFSIKEIEERFQRHYFSCSLSNPDRCVDDRKRIFLPGYQYDNYDNTDNGFLGRQFAGGSFSPLRVLRLIGGFSEEKAREIILQTYLNNGWRLGNHIDDEHGKIKNPDELEIRNQGCGNQDKIREGSISMYNGIVKASEVDSGFDWLRQNGVLAVLSGPHDARGAGVNLKPNTTYNTNEGVENGDGFFNLDLWAASQLAKELYKNSVLQNISDFKKKFIAAIARDYLQTLQALNGPKEIQIHS